MATTTANLGVLARRFQALSDETRLKIVQLLSGGEQCVCDLQTSLGAAQSRLSYHLKTLKDAGLVVDRPDGRWVHYSLSQEALEELREVLGEKGLMKANKRSRTSCCR